MPARGEAVMRRRPSDTIPLLAAKWLGTATGVAGAAIVALNLGVVVQSFVLFPISSLLWTAVGCLRHVVA